MEEWRVVVGSEGRYEVSSLGNVRNASTKHILKTQSKHGYKRINIKLNGKNKNCSVHRLVAVAFIPNPENKPQVNHKDGVHDNNAADNLEWVTADENYQHAIENRLYEKGVEAAKKLGYGRYNRKDKPKAYLKKSERIRKTQYDELVNIAEELGVTVGSLSSLLRSAIDNDDVCVDVKAQTKIKPSEEFITKTITYYDNKIKCLETKIKAQNKLLQRGIRCDDPDCLIGEKRNYLTIIGYSREPSRGGELVCRCDCGKITLVKAHFRKSGKIKSCGCMHDELSKAANPADPRKSDWLHTVWARKHRDPVWCEEWKDYMCFYDWAYANGYCFGKHLHRIDRSSGYTPENCKWEDTHDRPKQYKKESPKYQVNGELLTVKDAALKYGVLIDTIRYRMKRGMTLEEAINTPLCNNGRKKNRLIIAS